MIIHTANEGRQHQKNNRNFSFSETVAKTVYDMMEFFGVYGIDNDGTVKSWCTKLIVDNYNWPGSLPIIEVLTRFRRAAISGLYGSEAKTPEKLIIMFRKWIDEGDKRQQLFLEINGEKKQPKQAGRTIREFTNDEILSQRQLLRMMGVSHVRSLGFDGVEGYIARLENEYELRGLTNAT